MFISTSTAEAKPAQRTQQLTAAPDEDKVEMNPCTWFCLIHSDAEDFAACEAGVPEPTERAQTDTFATETRKHRDHDGPGWLCPAGTTAVAFDQPIYDDETGLFQVDSEIVWYCVDLSGGPEG